MKTFYLLLLFIFAFTFVYSQKAPEIQWEKTLSGSLSDQGSNTVETADGGFVNIGLTYSTDGDFKSTDNIPYHVFIIKFDSFQNVVWKQLIGVKSCDGLPKIDISGDGFLISGWWTEPDEADGYRLYKLNNLGNIVKKKVFSGPEHITFAYGDVVRVADGYVVTKAIHPTFSNADLFITKLDENFNEVWKKVYGGAENQWGANIICTPDGGFLVAGYYDLPSYGGSQLWILKVNHLGDLEWENKSTVYCLVKKLIITNEGDYIIAGYGQNIGNHGSDDYWIRKIDKSGNVIWTQSFGGSATEVLTDMIKTNDGNYIVSGVTYSNDGDVLYKTTNAEQLWLLKIDASGKIIWQKILGSSIQYIARGVIQTVDRGYLLSGASYNTGSNEIIHKSQNLSLVKLKPEFPVNIAEPESEMVLSDGKLNPSFNISEKTNISQVAADGVTKLLVTTTSDNAVTYTLIGAKAGKISDLKTQDNYQTSLPILVEPVNGKATLVYTAPEEYGMDSPTGERNIRLFIKKSATDTITINLKIVNPPIVFVHGMWSNPEVWKTGNFSNQLYLKGFTNLQFADYSAYNYLTFDPEDISSAPGRYAILSAIKRGLAECKAKGIACRQVNIVAHSLGGLMSKSLAQQTDFSNTDNFFQGYIHKLITIGTPHLGSPLGPLLYEQAGTIAQSKDFNLTLSAVLSLANMRIGSAQRDFNPDISKNPALQHISKTKNLLAHSIVGNWQPDAAKSFAVMNALTSTILGKELKEVFSGEDNDLIVGIKSQAGGLTDNATTFSGTTHSDTGEGGVRTETSNAAIQIKVAELLLSGKIAFADEFPKPSNNQVTPKASLLAVNGRLSGGESEKPLIVNDHFISFAASSRSKIVSTYDKSITFNYLTSPGTKISSGFLVLEGSGFFELPAQGQSVTALVAPAPGKFKAILLARDASGKLICDSTTITIQTQDTLISLSSNLSHINLDSLNRVNELIINAKFSAFGSQSIRNVTRAGVRYSLKNNSQIISVEDGGRISAKKPGIDTLLVSYLDKTLVLPILVSENFRNVKMNVPILSVTNPGDKYSSATPFLLNASSSSPLPLTYKISGPASISEEGLITVLGPGKVSIEIGQKADAFFAEAKSQTISFCVNPPVVTRISGSQNTCLGSQTYSVEHKSNLIHKWMISPAVSFATQDTSIIVKWEKAGVYKISAFYATTDGCTSEAYSIDVSVTPAAVPLISGPPVPIICSGDSIILTTALKTDIHWFRDGQIIPGAIAMNLTVKQQGKYSVKTNINSICEMTSGDFVVQETNTYPNPTISAIGGRSVILKGDSVVLSASNGQNWQWFKDRLKILGATSNIYIAKETGLYHVVSFSGSKCASQSNDYQLQVNFSLNPTNFKIQNIAASCKGMSNGIIKIKAVEKFNYKATLTALGITKQVSFTDSSGFADLKAGNYKICITVESEPNYQQCFDIVVAEPKDLTLFTALNKAQNEISLNLAGGNLYRISLNGNLTVTTANQITIPVFRGINNLSVSTDLLCQGIISKTIIISETIQVFPNPFESVLHLTTGLANANQIAVDIYTPSAVKVYTSKLVGVSGYIDIDLHTLPSGLYILKLNVDGVVKTLKIVKK